LVRLVLSTLFDNLLNLKMSKMTLSGLPFMRPHSALIPNSLMSGHHFSAPAFTSASSASGVCCSRGKSRPRDWQADHRPNYLAHRHRRSWRFAGWLSKYRRRQILQMDGGGGQAAPVSVPSAGPLMPNGPPAACADPYVRVGHERSWPRADARPGYLLVLTTIILPLPAARY
jgi:hypothetical protein